MRYSEIFKEARRLHQMGFAIHWLHARSKRPVEAGWGSGPRKPWKHLDETYSAGLNVGVRLGEATPLKGGFLTVIDVDIKGAEDRHRHEALAAAGELLNGIKAPMVRSGRGGGSRHYYCISSTAFKTWNPAQSKEIVKVMQPSKKPSKAELRELTEKEIDTGLRLSHAWEISLYSNGRQVVLPPSVHPDSGELYTWVRALGDVAELPVIEFREEGAGVSGNDRTGASSRGPVREANRAERSDAAREMEPFDVSPVDLGWLAISDEVRDGIVDGKGVEDRSGFLLKASSALLSAGLTQNEVLTVLTDPETFLGACGYDHAKTKDRARAAAWVYRYTLKKVASERSAAGVFGKASDVKEGRKLSEAEMAEQSAEFEADRNWKQDLVRGGQNGNGPPQKLVKNVVMILKNEVCQSVIKRDEFAYRDTYECSTPWGGKAGNLVGDDDVARIKYWLGVKWAFEPNNNVISDALIEIACQNAYDPVRDMLDELPAWDEVPRLDRWLVDHFEARGDKEYLAQVFRKWMVAMIVRVYEPGAKFDWMPIFEGAQGVGKSSFGRLLVGDKHFLDWLPNLTDKDSALSLQGMWGVEMGELSQFRKNELESIKAFITRTVDKLRPPYGRRLIESPRRCVFFGTTNRETYLTDETGNRRFKPVVVGNLDFEELRKDRLQLFAEAKSLYDRKVETAATLELTGEAKVFEKKIQDSKMVEDESHAMAAAMEDLVEKVRKKKTVFDLEKFRILELFDGGGALSKWRPENRNLQFASKMLRRMGGERRKVQGLMYWKIDGGGGLDGETRPPPHPLTNGMIREEKDFF